MGQQSLPLINCLWLQILIQANQAQVFCRKVWKCHGARGSVIPFFSTIKDKGTFPITNEKMTRFMITLEEGVDLVLNAFKDMVGGEIYVKKIPSMRVTEIASTISNKAKHQIIGIRPGEKIHEQMIGEEDSPYTYEYDDYFKILPSINNWHLCRKELKMECKFQKTLYIQVIITSIG